MRTSRVALLLLCLCLSALAGLAAAGEPARFLSYPSIHGDTIVFTYEGDLWSVPVTGGPALRLTTHPANEWAAVIAPDGKTIAFTGQYDGAPAVYLMPITGGPPRRLTYNGSGVQAVAWTPDGKRIVFRSTHENTFRPIARLFSVPVDGSGLPEPLPVDRGTLCSFSPDGTRMAYNRRGREDYYWKRYKGGQHVDLWMYDFNAKTFAQLTDYVGKNAWPMWIGNRIFFVSDRGANGISNLYAYDLASKQVAQVTTFDDFDVQWPSTDGTRIVFTQGGRLFVLDPASGAPRRIEVEAASDRWQLAPRTINPRDYIQAMSVSSDGKTAVFEARGDVFLVPADENLPTRSLTGTSRSRERYPQLSPDGSRVAFFSDKTGEYQLYVMPVSGAGAWEPVTTDLDRTAYHVEWSPDGTKLLFANKDFTLSYVDVATKKLVKIASSSQLKNDEFYWEVSDYTWSPDSKWVAYSFVQYNRNNQVFLYSLEQDRSFPVTTDFYDSLNPAFDANGDLLYFLSYRNFSTRIDLFEDNHVIDHPVEIMAVQLRAGEPPPFSPQPADRKPEAQAVPFRVDTAGLAQRVFKVPVPSGNYYYLKAGRGKLTWASIDRVGESEIEETFKPSGADKWTLHVYDVASRKDVSTFGGDTTISDWRLSTGGDHALVKKGNDYHLSSVAKLSEGKSLGTKLNLGQMSYRFTPADEWAQIFDDTWRWYREFFYDSNMHGRDWKKIGDSYRAQLPSISSREQLNWLLSEMVGELNVSHTYITGGDPGPARMPEVGTFPGLLGADLRTDASGYPRFARILGPTPYNASLVGPLVRPDIKIAEGDYLIAIDGHDVKAPENPYRLLQVARGQKVRVTVNSKPTSVGAATYDVEPVRSENDLRYNRWLADNIDKVLAASNGEIGYMHITAMSTDNIGQFDKFWRAFRYKKGLVIDVRGNGGGWTEYFLIDKLERKMVAYNVLRNVEPFRYPGSVSNAHLVAVTNEYNGSDGEAFLAHFKARKLGTIIGVPSWGGLVGIINAQRTIDNGSVNQSNNAFYGAEGAWWVENHGADPDIVVDNDPASASAGRDLQLEKAIEVLKEQIAAEPFTFPARPKYPVR